MNDYELLRIVDFLDKVRQPFLGRIAGAEPDPYWNITSALIRAHLTGRPMTISTLAQLSGAPYATGLRKIAAMEKRGQILRKTAGATGKSFTLHPSTELLRDFTAHAAEVKTVIARTIGLGSGKENEGEYYFGGSAYGADMALPPKLAKRRPVGTPAIRFLLNDDNYFQAMRNIWRDIRHNLGSRSSFDLRPLPQLYREAERTLGTDEAAHDVVSLNMPWLGEFAEAGRLRPLDDLIGAGAIRAADFHQSIWQTGTWRGRQYGIPIYCTAEALLARRDLFEGSFGYPRRFDEVLTAARELHRPDEGFYGMSWNGARGMPIASTFMFLMSCCGNSVISTRSGRPLTGGLDRHDELAVNVDTETGRLVLDHLQASIAYSPPNVLTADWDDALDTFLTGHAAMAYAWTMRAARCEYDLRSVVKRKVTYLPHPAGPGGTSLTPLGGFVLAIPANLSDERAELAFAAIEWMASHDAMERHVRNGLPVAPRFFVSPDPEAAASAPIVQFVDRAVRQNRLHAWPRPSLPQYRAIEGIIGTDVHRALSGEIGHVAALRNIQAGLEAAVG